MAGVALITGGGSGLGREVGLRLSRRGLSVTVVGRRRAPLEAVAEACEGPVLAWPADVREPREVRAAVQATVSRFGRLDVVVNSAALLAGSQGQSVGRWDYFSCVLRTNVLGPALVADTAAEAMGSGGVIVHIGSSIADVPTPDAVAYGASKAALAHLTASQDVRLRSRGIRVVGLAPGGLHREPGPDGLSSLEAAAETVIFLASRWGRRFRGTMLRMDDGEVPRGFGPPPGGSWSSR